MGWSEAYPVVHRSLAPEYRGLPVEQVERLLGEVFGERVDIEQVESFLGDLGGGVVVAVRPSSGRGPNRTARVVPSRHRRWTERTGRPGSPRS